MQVAGHEDLDAAQPVIHAGGLDPLDPGQVRADRVDLVAVGVQEPGAQGDERAGPAVAGPRVAAADDDASGPAVERHGDELADAGRRRGAGVAHAGGHQAQAGRRGHLHQPGSLGGAAQSGQVGVDRLANGAGDAGGDEVAAGGPGHRGRRALTAVDQGQLNDDGTGQETAHPGGHGLAHPFRGQALLEARGGDENTGGYGRGHDFPPGLQCLRGFSGDRAGSEAQWRPGLTSSGPAAATARRCTP